MGLCRELAYLRTNSMAEIILNHEKANVINCEKVVATLMGAGSHSKNLAKLDIDLKNRKIHQ